MWCPRCDQGEVKKAVIKALNKAVFVCEECEATWASENDVGVNAFEDFATNMNRLGLQGLWSDIKVK